MSEIRLARGASGTYGFIVKDTGDQLVDVTGGAIVFSAWNATLNLTKTWAGGQITVTDPTTGAGYVTITPSDTASWPASVSILEWTLVVTLPGAKVYPVDSGWLVVEPAGPSGGTGLGSAYCVPADVKAALSGNTRLLAGITGQAPTAVPSDVAIAAAAERGARLMDRYFLGRADTPITGPEELLRTLREANVTLTIWKLFEEQLIAESYRSFEDDKNDVIRWLEKIQAGKGSLLSATASAAPVVDGGFGGSNPQVFGADPDGNVVIF